jgi:hypothetical protein
MICVVVRVVAGQPLKGVNAIVAAVSIHIYLQNH